ncbi:MAG: DUF1330 domain-containing protein [Alphaproteobacteria bacterium]|nr:DUF1330 domain-containing protein [Alphaproteobacteria bacterium]
MVAYVIIDSDVHDPERMKAYGAKVRDTLQAHGGKPVIASSPIEVLEGDWNPARIVMLEFADADAARAWYNSPEYQEILPIRLEAANDKLLIVEGV